LSSFGILRNIVRTASSPNAYPKSFILYCKLITILTEMHVKAASNRAGDLLDPETISQLSEVAVDVWAIVGLSRTQHVDEKLRIYEIPQRRTTGGDMIALRTGERPRTTHDGSGARRRYSSTEGEESYNGFVQLDETAIVEEPPTKLLEAGKEDLSRRSICSKWSCIVGHSE